ncbi:hypothetical protein C7I85_27785 [Mesorhizobium soli]|uniref:Uncharacterized protein n=1 Tax=Pseudaminobacter soli (ex Li et al. 2025) TaxID=1295366 RepID=A0A2P7RU89_9HYPH|nr:hypothetical protein C7I85_27785 [Mesorhizobium soli]
MVIASVAVATSPSFAQSTIRSVDPGPRLLESYIAYIGPQDLYNSRGIRLTEPWQILRQDRANFHRYGKADRADQYDSFFADERNRAAKEVMLMRGTIQARAARDLVSGGAMILVEIYGRGSVGEYIDVSVMR